MPRLRGRPSEGEYLLEFHRKTLFLLGSLRERGIDRPSSLERDELVAHIMDILELGRSTAYMWANFLIRLSARLY